MDGVRHTMDFYEHQDRARARSGRLVLLYTLAVIAVVVSVSLLTALVVSAAGGGDRPPQAAEIALASGAMGLVTLLLIGGGSMYRIAELRGGGKTVALALGGRPIDHSTTNADERRVLNVVEEMAIASGVPVPPVYLLHKEAGINAFAAGYSPGDAVIGVTRGCVEGLTRDELQGVMAHEFSHILNGDMRLNIRMIGLLNGILLLSLVGYTVLRFAPISGGSRNKNGGSAILAIYGVGIGLLIIGSVGSLAARIIQAAVSREREFLADASAVQFTRNPSGIGNALRRIGGGSAHARVKHPRAQEAGHMFFGEAIAGFSLFGSALASHPPLPVRIKRVDPSWDGTMLPPLTRADRVTDAGPRDRPPTPRERLGKAIPPVPGGADRAAALLPLLALAGQPAPEHVEHARSLILAIPEKLREAARQPYSARAVVYALLLDREDDVRERQLAGLDRADRAMGKLARGLAADAVALPRGQRLPLLDMTLGALGHMSESQHNGFRDAVRGLIQADRKVDLFEWVTLGVLTRHLDAQFGGGKPKGVHYFALNKLGDELSVLLSVMSHAGADGPEGAARAFGLGAGSLPPLGLRLLDPSESNLDRLDAALNTLATVTPKLKRDILRACALCAGADGVINTNEAELLRAIADTLGVPVPPLLPGQKLV